MLKYWMAIPFLILLACVEPAKQQTKPSKTYSDSDLVGLVHGGSIENDSSRVAGQFVTSKKKSGLEYAMVIWGVCKSGEKWDLCKKKIEVTTLSRPSSSGYKDGQHFIVVESKITPPGKIQATFCTDPQNYDAIAWIDYSDINNQKIDSAWVINDSLLKWIPISTDSIHCQLDDSENSG